MHVDNTAIAPFALAVFTSYFLVILALFGIIIKDLFQEYAFQKDLRCRRKATMFTFIAIGSFAHTWYYMFRFMEWSFNDHESKFESYNGSPMHRLSKWLVDTALFEQAWYTVCSGSFKWWLSEQLCSYTVGAWTILIFVQGNRHKIKHVWAYMLLGQLVAISVASNLFYIALSLSKMLPAKKVMFAGPALWLSVLVSLIAVSYTPFTDERSFLPNLLVMHVSAMAPLLCGASLDSTTPRRFSLSVRSLYLLVFITTACLHTRNSMVLFLELEEPFFDAFWRTLFSHPAQSSIGWDVIWTSASFMVWNIMSRPMSNKYCIISSCTVLASVGVVAPFLAFLEIGENEPRLRLE